MKIPVKNEAVTCPRTGESVEINVCKHCSFLGWVTSDKVVCRWTKEKEELINGERHWSDIVGYEKSRLPYPNL